MSDQCIEKYSVTTKNNERNLLKLENEINLEELFAKESETIDSSARSNQPSKLVKQSEKSKNKRQKKKDKNSTSGKVKRILLKTVLPSVATGAVCFFIGGLIFSKDDTATEKVMTAQTIKSSNPALENANSVKDTQIESLKRQLSELSRLEGSQQILTDNGKDPNNLAFAIDVNTASIKGLDDFFTKVLAISPTANDQELQTIRSDLSPYFTSEASVSKLYTFLSNASAAKELGQKTIKVASPTVTLASSESANRRRYFVIVPFATSSSDKIYNAFYVVEEDKDHKISDIKYAGYSDSAYSKVAHQLFKSEDQVNNEIKSPNDKSSEKSSTTSSSN